MIFLAFALMYGSGIAGTIYLVVNGHPWFGAFVLLSTCGLEMKRERK